MPSHDRHWNPAGSGHPWPVRAIILNNSPICPGSVSRAFAAWISEALAGEDLASKAATVAISWVGSMRPNVNVSVVCYVLIIIEICPVQY